MEGRSKEDLRTVRNRLIFEDASAWIGRIFATMLFMTGPAAFGYWLDQQLQTKFMAAMGVILGMALGITALLVLVSIKRPPLDDRATHPVGDSREGNDPDAGQQR